jgi:hypothetical protein
MDACMKTSYPRKTANRNEHQCLWAVAMEVVAAPAAGAQKLTPAENLSSSEEPELWWACKGKLAQTGG